MSRITDLNVDECLALLRSRRVGRLALRTEAGLRIFPVNYSVVGDDVVFRTLPYGAIANSAHEAEAAFEVDDVDEEMAAGWSVVAAGRCRRVEDFAEVTEIRREDDPRPWADGQRNLYFRLQWDELSGRRIGEEATSLIPQQNRPAAEPSAASSPARSV